MEKNKKVKVVSVVNQKGGVGKTTAVRNIAYALKLAGRKVICIDTDPQGSLRRWGHNGGSEFLPIVGVDYKGTLESTIENLKQNSDFDTFVIDTKPSLSTEDKNIDMVEVIKVTNIAIIAVLPSEDDIVSASPVVSFIQSRVELGYDIKPFFLIGRANPKYLAFRAAKKIIKDTYEKIPIIEQPITDKQAYILSYSTGTTILHTKETKLIKERRNMKKISNQLLEVINAV